MMADFEKDRASDPASPLPGEPAGREALCALFDGELEGDAARFTLKRLSHDAEWRDTCGRWQLVGDVLRGQSQAAAPPHFAERVARALAAEEGAVAVSAVAGGGDNPVLRRRWIPGAALAASVAVVALMVGLPSLEDPVPRNGELAAAQPQVALDTGAVAVPEPGTPSRPAMEGAASAAAAAALAAVERSRRRAPAQESARSSRSRSATEETALAQADAPDSMVEPAVADSAIVEAWAAPGSAVAEIAGSRPFQPPADPATVRPWPRAVLPGYAAGGGFTASFGDSAVPPSFYPFEPQGPVPAAQRRPDPLPVSPQR